MGFLRYMRGSIGKRLTVKHLTTVCLQSDKGQVKQLSLYSHTVFFASADSTGYCTLWRAYMGKRRVDQIMRSNAFICAHSGAPSFRKAHVRARRSW